MPTPVPSRADMEEILDACMKTMAYLAVSRDHHKVNKEKTKLLQNWLALIHVWTNHHNKLIHCRILNCHHLRRCAKPCVRGITSIYQVTTAQVVVILLLSLLYDEARVGTRLLLHSWKALHPRTRQPKWSMHHDQIRTENMETQSCAGKATHEIILQQNEWEHLGIYYWLTVVIIVPLTDCPVWCMYISRLYSSNLPVDHYSLEREVWDKSRMYLAQGITIYFRRRFEIPSGSHSKFGCQACEDLRCRQPPT